MHLFVRVFIFNLFFAFEFQNLSWPVVRTEWAFGAKKILHLRKGGSLCRYWDSRLFRKFIFYSKATEYPFGAIYFLHLSKAGKLWYAWAKSLFACTKTTKRPCWMISRAVFWFLGKGFKLSRRYLIFGRLFRCCRVWPSGKYLLWSAFCVRGCFEYRLSWLLSNPQGEGLRSRASPLG